MLLNQLLQVAELNYSEALCQWSKRELKHINYLNNYCWELKDEFEQLKYGNRIRLTSLPDRNPSGTPEPSLFQYLNDNACNLDDDERRELTSIELDSICDLFNTHFGPILSREEIWKGIIDRKFHIDLKLNIPLSKSEQIARKFHNSSNQKMRGHHSLTARRFDIFKRVLKLRQAGYLEKVKVSARGDIVVRDNGVWLMGKDGEPLTLFELERNVVQKYEAAMMKPEKKRVQEK